jgi:hypothetical protein
VRTSRRKRAREEWIVLIEDHHEGYLTWQEYLVIETKLAANNTQKRARPVREATALCQGISRRPVQISDAHPGRNSLRTRSDRYPDEAHRPRSTA